MPCIVALDGPCASGKGTVAREVAQACGLAHVDTGAVYRVLAHEAQQKAIEPRDGDALAQLARSLTIEMRPESSGVRVWCNSRDVTQLIRTDTVGQAASRIAIQPAVRQALLDLQRHLASSHPEGAVVEGRDIGTAVFPNATVKIFLTAAESERARRRHAQLSQLGQRVSYEEVLRQLHERDQRDSSREVTPLRQADNAATIDCTTLTVQQVVDRICQLARPHLSDQNAAGCRDAINRVSTMTEHSEVDSCWSLSSRKRGPTNDKVGRNDKKKSATAALGGPRGMPDLLEETLTPHQHITASALTTCDYYGYHQIQTPLVEPLALFERGVGENTDVVQKEMYVLRHTDPPLCLRPENTAGVVRAVLQHGLLRQSAELKLCYAGPMFRHEKPQKGRLRQFHQVGAEAFGCAEPSLDVEVITLLHQWLGNLGLPNLRVRINSLGTPRERRCYGIALAKHLRQHAKTLCEDCRRRVQTNPLRVLDCKKPECARLTQGAPTSLEMLTPDSRTRFETVEKLLRQADIAARIDGALARGLDYYTHTVFEVVCEQRLGAQNAVAGGGRYDELVQNLGGPATPAVGFAAGVERLALVLDKMNAASQPGASTLVLIHADAAGRELAHRLARELRQRRQRVELPHTPRSVKAQLRHANRLGADWALVLGESEAKAGSAALKHLRTGREQTIELGAQEIVARTRGEQNP
ncbi:MAG: histidine--tRNA ligase [Myxococcota bacterium]